MKKIIVIPARISSTRLPKKVMLSINKKTLLQRVFEQCIKVKNVSVFIATDSYEVRKSCLNFTDNIIMTSSDHKSGTERIVEATKKLDYNFLINVQADQLFVSPKLLEKLFALLIKRDFDIATVCERISSFAEILNPNIVKLVKNINNEALYFSRSPIPYINDNTLQSNEKLFFDKKNIYKHVGIYGYKKEFLEKYNDLVKMGLENIENLEQLRILENGFKINLLETTFKSFSIDTKEDYKNALKIIKSANY